MPHERQSNQEDPAQDAPWAVLGLPSEANEREIRQAYLAAVKAHPPDRDPERFQAIRDAYETLRDPQQRARRTLLAADPDTPLAAAVDTAEDRRAFTGPNPWLAVLETPA